MEKIDFNLEGDYIELIQLLKAIGVAQTGGHARMMVENGEVLRKGEIESRKRAKIRRGDVLSIDNVEITIL